MTVYHEQNTENPSRVQESDTKAKNTNLHRRHRAMLCEDSGIDPDVVAERGYWTAENRTQLADFGKNQRRAPALMLPMFSPDGETESAQIRPDSPRDPKRKYEAPSGRGSILDVHPRNESAVQDPEIPLYITEGVKKGDAMTSRGLCAVALAGVWNWQRDGELLPCWEHVEIYGRTVYIVFDSDVTVKSEVQLALERLTGALEARGADVLVVYLNDADDGSKLGVDDWMVLGGDPERLPEMARPFEPSEVVERRLSKDEKLRARINEAWGIYQAMPTVKRQDNTARDFYEVYAKEAERFGVLVEDGIRISLARLTAAERAGASDRTAFRTLLFMEDQGYIRRDNAGRQADKAGAIVLLTVGAHCCHNYRGSPDQEEESLSTEDIVIRGYDTNARPSVDLPKLRWGSVTVRREKDRRGHDIEVRRYQDRPGKKRGEILRYILESGGSVTIDELHQRFGGENTRRRDFCRRMLAPMADGPALIELDGGEVRAAESWREALDYRRELGDEPGIERRQRVNHELRRAAFHRRHENPVDHSPTEEEMDAAREERERLHEEELQRPVSPLAEAMRAYLKENPHHAEEPAGWIGSTLWAYGLYEGKPTAAESKAAFEELGGRRFLQHLTEAPAPIVEVRL